jgi:peptidoglycan hydrolase-like protein with peptidoglycan-binding domain
MVRKKVIPHTYHLRFFLFFFIAFFSMYLSVFAEPTVFIVQKKLKSLGLYLGTIDGLPGSKTHAAIRRYQIKNRLTITGELNEETLRSLKILPASKK